MTIFKPSDLITIAGEPRVLDSDLARALGLGRATNIRQVIARNMAELQGFGEVCIRDVQTTEAGGRPGRAYHLNEGQALLICIISRTATAATVRRSLINVFMAYRRKKPVRVREHVRALPKTRRIKSRDDLSFTRREGGRLNNWFVPPRLGDWHEHYYMGESWFAEIAELAKVDPEEAYHAARLAGSEMTRYALTGHAEGFFDAMAQWAVSAAMTRPDPALPFRTMALGVEPLEGMDHYRTGAA